MFIYTHIYILPPPALTVLSTNMVPPYLEGREHMGARGDIYIYIYILPPPALTALSTNVAPPCLGGGGHMGAPHEQPLVNSVHP